jgi:hypothetical protein
MIRIVALAMERILGHAGAEPSALAIEDRNANAESAEVDACYRQTSFAFSIV